MNIDYSRKDIILIKDLGIVDGSRKGVYECNICGTHIIKFTANALKGNGRCKECARLAPLVDMPLRLIEDLGMVYINEDSKRKTRMCVVECPVCQEEYTTSANDVKSGKSSMCRKCSLSMSVWSDSEWELKGGLSNNFDSYKVYIIKLDNPDTGESFYKIGKTYTTVKSRYSRERKDFPYTIELLYEYIHESGVHVSKLERLLHKTLKHLAYIPQEDFNGKMECYSSVDIEQIKDIIKEVEL